MFIEVYNACGDSMKEAVVSLLILFFTTLDKTDAESVAGEKDNDGKGQAVEGMLGQVQQGY